jgi:hypothetical protein
VAGGRISERVTMNFCPLNVAIRKVTRSLLAMLPMRVTERMKKLKNGVQGVVHLHGAEIKGLRGIAPCTGEALFGRKYVTNFGQITDQI